jgi:hypothetical protein
VSTAPTTPTKPAAPVKTTKKRARTSRATVPPVASSGPVTPSTPFIGTGYDMGALIPFAGYDNGGADIGFHTPVAGGGIALGYSASQQTSIVYHAVAGEWMNYTINLSAAAPQTLFVKAGATQPGGTFHFEIDGQRIGGSVRVPFTGSDDSSPTLTAGKHIVRVVMDAVSSNGTVGNFSWFSVGSPTTSVAVGTR